MIAQLLPLHLLPLPLSFLDSRHFTTVYTALRIQGPRREERKAAEEQEEREEAEEQDETYFIKDDTISDTITQHI